jgi:hypothetical protein
VIRAFWRRFWAAYYQSYDEATERYQRKKQREALDELSKAMRKYGLTEKDRRPMAGRES